MNFKPCNKMTPELLFVTSVPPNYKSISKLPLLLVYRRKSAVEKHVYINSKGILVKQSFTGSFMFLT